MNIWMYWETPPGGAEPAYIKLCREIVNLRCTNHDVYLVTPENLSDFLPDINVDLDKIHRKERPGPEHNIPVKTAYLRTKLLQTYGGLWLDSDFILINSLDFIHDGLDKYDLMVVHKRSGGHDYYSNGFLAAPRDGKIISKYVAAQEERFKAGYALNWGEIGARMLTPAARSFPEDSYYLIKEQRVQPIPYQNYQKFFTKSDPSAFIKPDTVSFMLFNNLFPKEFKLWGREEVLNSDLFISKVFKIALGG